MGETYHFDVAYPSLARNAVGGAPTATREGACAPRKGIQDCDRSCLWGAHAPPRAAGRASRPARERPKLSRLP